MAVSDPLQGLTVQAQTESSLEQITEDSKALYIDQNGAKCAQQTQKCGYRNVKNRAKVYCGTL